MKGGGTKNSTGDWEPDSCARVKKEAQMKLGGEGKAKHAYREDHVYGGGWSEGQAEA